MAQYIAWNVIVALIFAFTVYREHRIGNLQYELSKTQSENTQLRDEIERLRMEKGDNHG